MSTCFICGAFAEKHGWAVEPLCKLHLGVSPERVRSIKAVRNSMEREWQMLRDIAAWHAGSAYEIDQARAKRASAVLKELRRA